MLQRRSGRDHFIAHLDRRRPERAGREGRGLLWTIKVSQRMWAMSLRKGVFMQPVQSWSIQSGASCCRGVRRG